MSSIKKEKIEESEKSREENPRRKSKGNFIREKGFHNKRSFIKSPYKFGKWEEKKRTATHVLCHSIRSFGNKPLVASIDLRNKKNVIVIFQSVIKVKELEGKYSFKKNIIFLRLYPQYIFNFNKYFVHIIFLFCFANLAGPKFKQFVRTIGFGKNKIICYNKS